MLSSLRVRSKVFVVVSLMLFLIITPLLIYLYTSRVQSEYKKIERNAETLSNHILLAGDWVRVSGGVYTQDPLSPNDEPEYQFMGPYSVIGALSAHAQEVQQHGFRLISLRPNNEDNYPDEQQYEVLAGFDPGNPLAGSYLFLDEDGMSRYMYIRPIMAEESCIRCHEDNGFAEGDVLGALALSLPFQKETLELRTVKGMFILLGSSAIGGTIFVLYFALGSIFLSPLQAFMETIKEATAGNWYYRTQIRTGDEWEELGNTYNMMASTIENVLQENEKMFLQTIQSITSALDARDAYTKGHSITVAALSRAIAGELGLTEQEQNRIEVSALLHDIGKIGIPDDILRKSGLLSDDEWLIIRQHPLLGAKILEPIASLKNDPGVLYHHERYDGKGYPYGVTGDEIPLTARIISVADAYHAMTSSRIYRENLTYREAIFVIRKNAGSQFCPRVVAAFLQCCQNGLPA